MANHLKDESSRYLQQHADNPVDWYPWGEAAFKRATLEDKPIFLSIGYSACHWCHVMAHESFEDEETAKLLNEHFVSIKVDREERPDLDRIYMNAVQAMTGRGGWPMSVFIAPDGRPFYGGTYFPADPRPGVPAFTQVLSALAEAWETRREELLAAGEELVEALEDEYEGDVVPRIPELSPQVPDTAYRELNRQFDDVHGGWGGAPKFPQPMAMAFLMQFYATREYSGALRMVVASLRAMAQGGIYDQLGGGFHRYSVDARWLVPHFEKMLYDNAQLARVYLSAWQESGAQLFRAVVEETLDYVAREMQAADGGFYATQDADVEGEEGRFFLWTPDEVREVLDDSADRFLELYNVTEAGNFEGRNILTFNGSFEEREAMADVRRQLFEAREQRTHPGRDRKIIASWNGLMLAAFAEAARVLDRDDYREIAERAAGFLLDHLRGPDGRLWHVWNEGEAKVPGLLDDHTHVIEGLLALYQTTFETRWYTAARDLADVMIEHFIVDPEQAALDRSVSEREAGSHIYFAGFYDTADDAENLVVRPRDMQDNAVPSGNAMAATVLLKLARFSGESYYGTIARRSLIAMEEMMAQHPLAFGQWLCAEEAALATPVEVAVIGDPDAEETVRFIDHVYRRYDPHRLVAAGMGKVPQLLAHRTQIEDRVTAYVCVDHVCQAPVTTLDGLSEQLP
jgi:uncharacterized protein YyaL (SSP411 family)